MQTLSLAFIGGGIGSAIGYTHFIASQMDSRFKLKAGCFSKDFAANKKSASLFGGDIRLYSNYESLLLNEVGKIDAICILTPTPSHKDIICRALELNYYVICEKTLCTNLKEALQIKKILDVKRSFLAITYNYTGYPMLRELQTMILNNEFGKLHNIQIEMPQEGFIRNINGSIPKPQNWRMRDLEIPIISLDLGVHILNIISFLSFKKPLSLFAVANSFGHFKNIIDDVNILAEFSDKLVANIWYSKSALGFRNGLRVRIFGEHLSAEWLQSNPEELLINTKEGERIIKDRASPNIFANKYDRFKAGHPAGFIEAFGNYYNSLADSIISFRSSKSLSPYIFGIDSAIEELKFLQAISKSFKSKRKVNL
ncbi:Gfo/Idh/MocA family protein [Helicobacter sp. MIT 14-3879]|uniref:Gfo/Idh/MocA family protein n=1 Tax=Helicobacter sp. MIT 14-3879 TaxID=2040649 RepID=UPI000E1EF745|nr:Gfo/Idh/MocA family oxidoreductase [Helicobacter sp. MIT 14-3879]RDU64788.1 gfo/Idh/MocA family oxidoreductase [Helicobacter sp. MIT 14-3879]